MKFRRSKLEVAVLMSLLACSACHNVWADDRVTVDGDTLKLTGVYANGSSNPYFKQNTNGTYVIEKNDGSSFGTIEHNDKISSGQYQFINVASGSEHYEILANKINLVSTYTDSGIYNFANGAIIDIGNENKHIEELSINAGYGLGNAARIVVGGNGNKINFYVDKMVLKLDKELGSSTADSALALGFGQYAKNGEININAASKLKIVGDIGNGLITPFGSLVTSISENSSIKINSDPDYSGTVQLKGNIYSYNIIKPLHTWEARDNYTYIHFSGNESFFTGLVYDDVYNWDGSTQLALHDEEGVYLKFTNGARWNMTDESQLAQLDASDGAVIDLTYDENAAEANSAARSARAAGEFKTLTVLKNFNGDGAVVKMKIDGTVDPNDATNSDKILVYGKHTGNTQIDITNIGSDYSKAVGTVLAQVEKEEGEFTVKDVEGALTWVKYNVDDEKQNDNSTNWLISSAETVTGGGHTTSVSTLLSTVTAGYDTWRNDTDKLNERMGELRLNGKENEGVWVRTKGSEFGRHGGNGVYTNKQQTYQLGYDAVTSKNAEQTTYTGVAAEYGKGNLTFERGTGTMKSLGLGLYQTQLRESGHYLDFIYKFDKYKNDFHVADTAGQAISGKYGNNAMSLSAEYGRQNQLKHGWYVEPQSELTLGYMWGNDFVTSNNIRVEQKNMPALIGRLGLNVGRNVGEKFNFYVKASINHDFLGGYDVQMTDLNNSEKRQYADDSFGSSWFDYGAGFSIKAGKDCYAYFDIERAMGGEYKKNWDWNAGLRWSF